MHNRFYSLPETIINKQILITEKKKIHHIVKVLRFGVGDNLIVFDGKGNQYKSSIKKIEKNQIELDIDAKSKTSKSPITITLACAIPKKAKFDFIVEKCTELGVDKIIPMKTDRTEVSLDKERISLRLIRWRKISIKASEQSQRSFIPQIDELKSFKETVSGIKSYDLAIVPALQGNRSNIADLLNSFQGRNVIVFIGPEGDFTPEEVELAKNLGCKLVSLGDGVLKVDTAAIYTVAILNYSLRSNKL